MKMHGPGNIKNKVVTNLVLIFSTIFLYKYIIETAGVGHVERIPQWQASEIVTLITTKILSSGV
jgi:hypothetical protein